MVTYRMTRETWFRSLDLMQAQRILKEADSVVGWSIRPEYQTKNGKIIGCAYIVIIVVEAPSEARCMGITDKLISLINLGG